MSGHTNAREFLVARLAIADRRKALLRQLDEIDAEARPYDDVIMGWLAEGRDIHLEHLDRTTNRWSRHTVRRDGWGRAEFVPAANVSALRLPDAPPIGADAATGADFDDEDDDLSDDAADVDLHKAAAAFGVEVDMDDPISEAAFRAAMEAEGGADMLRTLSMAEAG